MKVAISFRSISGTMEDLHAAFMLGKHKFLLVWVELSQFLCFVSPPLKSRNNFTRKFSLVKERTHCLSATLHGSPSAMLWGRGGTFLAIVA